MQKKTCFSLLISYLGNFLFQGRVCLKACVASGFQRLHQVWGPHVVLIEGSLGEQKVMGEVFLALLLSLDLGQLLWFDSLG